jgi:hypothetical protein
LPSTFVLQERFNGGLLDNIFQQWTRLDQRQLLLLLLRNACHGPLQIRKGQLIGPSSCGCGRGCRFGLGWNAQIFQNTTQRILGQLGLRQ